MMDCCEADAFAAPFDAEEARRDRDRYRAEGPDETTSMLLDMIRRHGVSGDEVLDIGGGIGVIVHELFDAGASMATLVEAAPAYAEAARTEAELAGYGERLRVEVGDFVRRAPGIGVADIVTLDRVICCYRDVDALVEASASHARRLYALVLPRDSWYVRLLIALDNVRWRARRSAYRAYAHSNARIDAHVRDLGLDRQSQAFTRFWRVVLYERRAAGG